MIWSMKTVKLENGEIKPGKSLVLPTKVFNYLRDSGTNVSELQFYGKDYEKFCSALETLLLRTTTEDAARIYTEIFFACRGIKKTWFQKLCELFN